MTLKRLTLFVFLCIISAIAYGTIPSGYSGKLIILGDELTPEYVLQLTGQK